jgi:hypothetical protein
VRTEHVTRLVFVLAVLGIIVCAIVLGFSASAGR